MNFSSDGISITANIDIIATSVPDIGFIPLFSDWVDSDYFSGWDWSKSIHFDEYNSYVLILI